jgi:hypothetical protein
MSLLTASIDDPGKGLAAIMGTTDIIYAAKVEELKPKINPQAKRIKITYGPFMIKGQEVKLVQSR